MDAKCRNVEKQALSPLYDLSGRKFYLVSLGCPKNEVDSECVSAILKNCGATAVNKPETADLLLLNTCGFIESAVKEAISYILELVDLKNHTGNYREIQNPACEKQPYLIVMGCMTQRYQQDVYKEFPEVDCILGTAEYHLLPQFIAEMDRGIFDKGRPLPKPGSLAHLNVRREFEHDYKSYAYIKIAEGCSNACAYCKIPKLRGGARSRSIEDIVEEARYLTLSGKKEIILIAQDTTRYGLDLKDGTTLTKLLQELTRKVPAIEKIRILYAYADAITDELIREISVNPKVCHYLDIPIQHASDSILRSMGRHETADIIRSRIQKMRQVIPDLVLRSTIMVGFPGETEEDFAILRNFVQEIAFDRLGCFIFSAEDGTRAAKMANKVDPATAQRRYDETMSLQQEITLEKNKNRIGQILNVWCEDIDASGILLKARSYAEAPEIDPVIHVAATLGPVDVGEKCTIKLIDADPYDLWGETTNEYSE